MVKVLGIDASPRKYGNTLKTLKIALRAAELEGAETTLIHLYDLDIKPCLGCVSDDVKACSYPCPIEDDMKWVYEEVLRSDGLVIATPVYWYNVSGPLKNFIDRLTVFENMIFIEGRSWVEGKVAGFIAMGNDVGALVVIQNLMSVMNSMGMVIPPWALAYFNSLGDATEVESVVLDAANVGRAVALMAKVLKGEAKAPKVWYRADSEYRELILRIARDVREECDSWLS